MCDSRMISGVANYRLMRLPMVDCVDGALVVWMFDYTWYKKGWRWGLLKTKTIVVVIVTAAL